MSKFLESDDSNCSFPKESSSTSLYSPSELRLYLAFYTTKFMLYFHTEPFRKGIRMGQQVWTLVAEKLNAISSEQLPADTWRKKYISAKFFAHAKFNRYKESLKGAPVDWNDFSVRELLYLQDLRFKGNQTMPAVEDLLKACEQKRHTLLPPKEQQLIISNNNTIPLSDCFNFNESVFDEINDEPIIDSFTSFKCFDDAKAKIEIEDTQLTENAFLTNLRITNTKLTEMQTRNQKLEEQKYQQEQQQSLTEASSTSSDASVKQNQQKAKLKQQQQQQKPQHSKDYEKRALELQEKLLKEKIKANKLSAKRLKLLQRQHKQQRTQNKILNNILQQLVNNNNIA